jgi:hypothetical protein
MLARVRQGKDAAFDHQDQVLDAALGTKATGARPC